MSYGGDRRSGGRGGGGGRGRGGGRGGNRFQKSRDDEPRINSEVQIFVQGLPHDVRESEIKQYFSSVGEIKNDKLTKKDRIWLYKDKNTGRPLGECTITYRNTETQQKALQHYHGEYFQGCKLDVTPSIVKPHMAKPPPPPARGRGGFGRGRGGGRGGFGGRGGRGGGGGHNSNYEELGQRRSYGGSDRAGGPSRSSYGSYERRDDRRDDRGYDRAPDYERRSSYDSYSRRDDRYDRRDRPY